MDTHDSSYLSTQYGSSDELFKTCSICFTVNQTVVELPCCREKALCSNCVNRASGGTGLISCWVCTTVHKADDLISLSSSSVPNIYRSMSSDENLLLANNSDSEKFSLLAPELAQLGASGMTTEKAQEEMELSSSGSNKPNDFEGIVAQLAKENEKLVESLNQKDMEIYLLSEEICKNQENSVLEASQLSRTAELEAERQAWQEERQQLIKKIEEVSQFQKAIDNLKHQLVSRDTEIRKLKELKPAPAIGIDIGTCHSRVAYFEDDQVHSVLNEREDSVINTNVKFFSDKLMDEDPIQIGVEQGDSANTVSLIKRLLCLNFDAAEKQAERHSFLFQLASGFGLGFDESNQTYIHVPARPDEDISILEIFSLILDKLKSNAQTHFKGRKVNDAVIVVPANYSDAQRQAVLDAANIVGLNVLRLINETNAAFHVYRNRVGENDKIRSLLIVSIGGGVSEMAYLQKTESGHLEAQECHAISFGGEDFDTLIVKHCLSIWRQQVIDEGDYLDFDFKNRQFLSQLKELCHKVKEDLSCVKTADINFKLPNETYFYLTILRKDFEDLILAHYLPLFRQLIEKVVQHRMPPEEIVLTGGALRIPILLQEIQRIFPNARICKSINYSEAIAQGAAIQAAMLSKSSQSPISMKIFPNFVSMTFDCFLIDTEIDEIIHCFRMVHSFPLPYIGRIYHGLPDRFAAVSQENDSAPRQQFAIKVNINKMPFGVAVLSDCRLDDFRFTIKLDKNGIITSLQVACGKQPGNTVSFQRFTDGISKTEARQIAGTLDNYHEEIENRMKQKAMCNKLDTLIAFAERNAAGNSYGAEFTKTCYEWVKWFDSYSNSSIQVLGTKYDEISIHLRSLGIEPPKI